MRLRRTGVALARSWIPGWSPSSGHHGDRGRPQVLPFSASDPRESSLSSLPLGRCCGVSKWVAFPCRQVTCKALFLRRVSHGSCTRQGAVLCGVPSVPALLPVSVGSLSFVVQKLFCSVSPQFFLRGSCSVCGWEFDARRGVSSAPSHTAILDRTPAFVSRRCSHK